MYTLRFVRANVSQKMFPIISLPTVENMTKHRQETMFPQQCLVCPGLKFLYLKYVCISNMFIL